MKFKRYFFVPYRGNKYEDGLLNRKKVMILGASYYCKFKDCQFFNACTGQWKTKDFDAKCPNNGGRPLHDLPKNEIDEDGAKSYKVFYYFMKEYLKIEKKFDDFWESVAFTNYIQHVIGGRTTTKKSDMSENDLLALGDVIRELEPDIVIIWGCVVNNPIKQKKDDFEDKQFENDFDGSKDSHYLFHWKIEKRKVTFVNFYHPSSSYFLKDQSNMKYYLDKAFKEE